MHLDEQRGFVNIERLQREERKTAEVVSNPHEGFVNSADLRDIGNSRTNLHDKSA